MTGSTKDDVDPEKMTTAELHAHFTRLLVGRAQDVDTRFGDTTRNVLTSDHFILTVDALVIDL
jgi:hypothetical protein